MPNNKVPFLLNCTTKQVVFKISIQNTVTYSYWRGLWLVPSWRSLWYFRRLPPCHTSDPESREDTDTPACGPHCPPLGECTSHCSDKGSNCRHELELRKTLSEYYVAPILL